MADMLNQSSSAGLQATAGLAGSLAMAGAYSGAKAPAPATTSDENCKENIELDNNAIDELLEELTGYSFNYKNDSIEDGYGSEGKKLGVMAQDMEEVAPEMVEEDENKIKMLNDGEMLNALLASTGRLHERLKKVEGK